MYLSFQIMFYQGKNGDCKEIYEGYSIFHSKATGKVDETLKTLTKEDGRRIISRVNSISLSRKKNTLFLSLQCYFILEFKIRDGYVRYIKLINEYMNT